MFPVWLTGSQCKPCCGLFDVPQKHMFFSQGLLFPDAAKHCALPSPKAAFFLLLFFTTSIGRKEILQFQAEMIPPQSFSAVCFQCIGSRMSELYCVGHGTWICRSFLY